MDQRRVKIWLAASAVVIFAVSFVYYFLNQQYSADMVVDDYILYSNPTFDYVYADTEPANEDVITSELETFAAKGEIEPVTFSIRANKDLGSVTVNVSDLTSSDQNISSENIDISNVKIWDQCGGSNSACDDASSSDFDSTTVPELLVKDNEQDLISAERGWVEDENKYYPPSLNENFNVLIQKDESHTFYISIRVPKDIDAGTYRGEVTVSAEGSESKKFGLALKVYDFELPKSDKKHVVYFNQQISAGLERQITKEVYGKYLDLFEEANIDGIVSYEETEVEWVVGQLASRGMSGPFVQIGIEQTEKEKLQDISSIAESQGFDVYHYTIDEPSTVDRMVANLNILYSLHQLGLKATTAIKLECHDMMQDENFSVYEHQAVNEGVAPPQALDLVNYAMLKRVPKSCAEYSDESAISFPEYVKGLQDGAIARKYEKEFFYQQIWPEDASNTRARFGFFLENSGLDGAFSYGVLSQYKNSQGNFYDDFDAPRKSIGSIYPSTAGPVRTLQWEAYRESIDDSRYVALLRHELEKVNVNESNAALRELKERLSAYSFGDLDGLYYDLPYEQKSDQYHQDIRQWIADKVIDIRLALANTSTCDDGIKNGDEEGVDCGGGCEACDQGGEDKEGVVESQSFQEGVASTSDLNQNEETALVDEKTEKDSEVRGAEVEAISIPEEPLADSGSENNALAIWLAVVMFSGFIFVLKFFKYLSL